MAIKGECTFEFTYRSNKGLLEVVTLIGFGATMSECREDAKEYLKEYAPNLKKLIKTKKVD